MTFFYFIEIRKDDDKENIGNKEVHFNEETPVGKL